MYYLQSRYYDPETGRFINADDASLLGANGDFASLNLFAYCGNNPIARKDDGGEFWHIVAGAVFGAATNLVANGIGNLLTGEAFFDGWGQAVITGAISGAATAICPALGTIVDAGISAVESIAEDVSNGENPATIITNATISVGFSLVTSGGSTFTNKKVVTDSLSAIGKTLPGNHPSVKKAAKTVLRTTSKKIRGEFLESVGEGVITSSFDEGVKIYAGMYTGSRKTQNKLRGYTY